MQNKNILIKLMWVLYIVYNHFDKSQFNQIYTSILLDMYTLILPGMYALILLDHIFS